MSDQYRVDESDGTSALRISVENRKQVLTQPANKSTINASSYLITPWLSCSGYDRIAVSANIYNQATKGITLQVDFSNDGVNQHGNTQSLGTGTGSSLAKETPVLGLYYRLEITNADTTARQCDAFGLLKP